MKKIVSTKKAISRKKLSRRIWENRWNYVFLLPAFLFFVLFCYVPMGGVVIAFKDYAFRKGIFGSEWVGLKHFERFFGSYLFKELLSNTMAISLYKIIFGFTAPIIFALLLNEIRNMKFKKAVQTISYLPYFMSWVVLGGILTELLSPSRGIVNQFLGLFGIGPIHFLGDSKYFRGVLVLSDIWQGVGWGSVIYLAAIAGVDVQQYESARIDGANRWDIAVRITLPSIMPTIVTMFILRLGGILSAGFDQVFNLYSPVVYDVGDIIDTWVYRTGLIDAKYDFATAVGLFKSVVGMVLVITANFITTRIGEGENKIW